MVLTATPETPKARPLKAILVIFGRSFLLFFFRLKGLEEYEK